MQTAPTNEAGPCVLWDQQEEFVDLLLQYLLDADPCCNPYVESTEASSSPPAKRTKCFDGELVHSSVLDQNETSALSTGCIFQRENLLTTRESPTSEMMDFMNRREHSVFDSQIACAQNNLPPPMPFVRNIRSHEIDYDATAPARQEYNIRVGLSLHAERLHTNRRKLSSNLL
jgi:hypothetical protein